MSRLFEGFSVIRTFLSLIINSHISTVCLSLCLFIRGKRIIRVRGSLQVHRQREYKKGMIEKGGSRHCLVKKRRVDETQALGTWGRKSISNTICSPPFFRSAPDQKLVFHFFSLFDPPSNLWNVECFIHLKQTHASRCLLVADLCFLLHQIKMHHEVKCRAQHHHHPDGQLLTSMKLGSVLRDARSGK